MQTAILILFNYTYYMCTYNSDFTLKNSSKPSDSGLEQRINGSVKMFSDIISENQQVIGNMQTNRFAQMDNEIKSMRQSMEKHLADMYKGFADISALSSGVSDLKKSFQMLKHAVYSVKYNSVQSSTKYLHRSNSTPMLQPYRTVPQLLNLRLNFRTTTKDLYIFRLIQNSRLTPTTIY